MSDIVVGDLVARLRLDDGQLDAAARSAIAKVRGIGTAIEGVKPKLGLDAKALDDGIKRAQTALGGIAKTQAKAIVTAETRGAEASLGRLQGLMASVDRSRVTAQAVADVDQAERELRELAAQLAQLDDRPAHVEVRANITQALGELRELRREMGLVEQDTVTVSTKMAGMGGTLAGIGRQALGVAGGIGIASAAMNVLGTAADFVVDAMFMTNIEMENVHAQLLAFTKDGGAAARILEDIKQEAKDTPFAFQELASAVAGLYPVAKQANEPLMELVETAEILAASNPAEGLAGAAFALREALSGDFTSIIERFNLPRQYINQLKEEGLPNIEIVRQAMQSLGLDISLVGNLAQTTSGKWSTFLDNIRNAAARVGEPFLDKVNGWLDEFNQFAETEQFSAMVDEWATKASDAATKIDDVARSIADLPDSPVVEIVIKLAAGSEDVLEAVARILEGDVTTPIGSGVDARNATLGDPFESSGGASAAGQQAGQSWYEGFISGLREQDLGEAVYQVLTYNVDQAIADAGRDGLDGLDNQLATATPRIEHMAGVIRIVDTVTQDYLVTLDGTTVMIDDLATLFDRAAEAAERDLGMTITANDVRRGYIHTTDGATLSLQEYILQQANHASQAQTEAAAEREVASERERHAQIMTRYAQRTAGVAEARESALRAASRENAEERALAEARAYALDRVYTLTDAEQILASNMSEVAKLATLQAQQFNALTGAASDLQSIQGELSAVQGVFSQQTGEYNATLQALEGGYEAIQAKQEAGIALHEDEIAFLEAYPGLIDRVEGGLSDAAIQEGMVAAAKTEVMLAQDELNAAIARGDENLGPYEEKLRNAQDWLNNVDPNSGFKQAMENLDRVIGEDLVAAIDELGRRIDELDGKVARPDIGVDTDQAHQDIDGVEGDLQSFSDGTYRAAIDLDTAPFYEKFYDLPKEFTVTGYVVMTGNTQVGITQNAAGGIIDRPMLSLIGEEAPAWPEFIIPTNPSRRDRALGLWLQAGHQLGVPGFADGGGPAGSGGGGPANADGHLIFDISVEPPDWGRFFAGIDLAAEDASERASDRFIAFFDDLGALADGSALAEAQAELEELLAIREIAIDTGAGAAVVAGIEEQIAAQEAQLAAIGAAMGTDVVAGLVETVGAADIISGLGQGLQQFSIDDIVSGDALEQLAGRKEDLLALLAVAEELGDAEWAAQIAAELDVVGENIRLVSEIAGSEAVAGLQEGILNAEATQAAVDAWSETLDVIFSGEAGSALARQQERLAQLQAQLQAALLDPSIPPEVAEALRASIADAEDELGLTQEALRSALTSGLIDEETLRELAASGGAAFRELYDALFGAGALAEVEAGWAHLSEASLAQLRAMAPEAAEVGAGFTRSLVEGISSGALAVEEALSFLTDENGEIVSEDAMLELVNMYEEAFARLQEAIASGADPTEAQANYDAVMALLAEYAAATGVSVDELIADWEKLDDVVETSTRHALDALERIRVARIGIERLAQVGGSGGTSAAGGGSLFQALVPLVTNIITLDSRPIAAATEQQILGQVPVPTVNG